MKVKSSGCKNVMSTLQLHVSRMCLGLVLFCLRIGSGVLSIADLSCAGRVHAEVDFMPVDLIVLDTLLCRARRACRPPGRS